MATGARPTLHTVSPVAIEGDAPNAPATCAPEAAAERPPAAAVHPRSDVRGVVRRLLGVAADDAGGSSAFTFFAALRRLECHFRSLPRWGEAARAADEAVRLGQDPSLAFRATALTSIAEENTGSPPRLM